jgi:hypothetical protein
MAAKFKKGDRVWAIQVISGKRPVWASGTILSLWLGTNGNDGEFYHIAFDSPKFLWFFRRRTVLFSSGIRHFNTLDRLADL